MKKTFIFTAIFALVATVALVAPVGVFAQYSYGATYAPAYSTYGQTYITNPTYVAPMPPVAVYGGTCVNLTSNLYIGIRDVAVGGQVSALQSFLISQGYLSIVAKTGYFGTLTAQAVSRYQSNHGLPTDGTVGVLTRASIQTVSCGNNSGYNSYNNGVYSGGYNGYGYNNSYNNYYGTAPVLSSLSVTSGPVGSNVTIYGTGFDLLNNTINFDGVKYSGIPSYQGTALAFTVPQVNSNGVYNYNYNNSYNNNYNNGYNATGIYPVTVTTSRGTSNSLSFTVTSYGNNNCYNNIYNSSYNYGYNNYSNNNCYNNNGSLSVSNVSGPTYLNTGTSGAWSLSLYNPNSNYVNVSVRWGDENNYGYSYGAQQSTQSSYTQGQQTISFTHTYQTAGNYTVVFTATDNQGAQTTVSATVNVSGSNYNNPGQPYLSSISPTSGRVGTQVVLYGSGFTPTGNVVHFGNGGMNNVNASSGGNTIYYTIPYTVAPCDINTGSTYCPTYAQQITPGSYAVYVSNVYGQTSTKYFNVTY